MRVLVVGLALLITLVGSVEAETGASAAVSPTAGKDGVAQILGLAGTGPDFLHPDVAFVLSVDLLPGKVMASWRVAEHYYLYRERIAIELVGNGAQAAGGLSLPKGKPKEDAYLGRTEVYYDQAWAELPIRRAVDGPGQLVVRVRYQGCADAGLCYPPITKTFELSFPTTSP